MNPINPRWALLAACMMHAGGYFSVKSSEFRHHNPGGLRQNSKDEVLVKFDTVQDGFNMLAYEIMKFNGTPVDKFLMRYAPDDEYSSIYIDTVLTMAGMTTEEMI